MIFTGFALAFISSAGIYLKFYIMAIAAYIVYYIIQNFWRPILVAQYDDLAESTEQATILSIESQTKTVGITILAPAAGYLADNYGIESSLIIMAAILLVLWLYLCGSREKADKPVEVQVHLYLNKFVFT
jgi:predicted MFS family arabinose efflux permease